MRAKKTLAKTGKSNKRTRAIAVLRPATQVYPRPSAAGLSGAKTPFGNALRIEALAGLTSELQVVRQYPPITKRGDGKYEGDILGFVRGLRLSARVLYFLRELLSGTGLEVSWGHLLNDQEESCSPECDIIVHEPGVVRRWNGFKDPVMNFSFVKAERVRLVVSCKSLLNSVDENYPRTLKKYGVKNVVLFAESCEESRLELLRKRALKAGYSGVWCLYTTNERDVSFLGTNDGMLIEFGQKVLASVASAAKGRRNKKTKK